MSLASNFGFIGEWCGIGDLPPSGIKDIGFLYTIPVNDSVPAKAMSLERRAVLCFVA
jgi:hypothetical protein